MTNIGPHICEGPLFGDPDDGKCRHCGRQFAAAPVPCAPADPMEYLRTALCDCLDVIEPIRDELRKQGEEDAANCCDEVIVYSRDALLQSRAPSGKDQP